jgi:molecular chaperone GrpE
VSSEQKQAPEETMEDTYEAKEAAGNDTSEDTFTQAGEIAEEQEATADAFINQADQELEELRKQADDNYQRYLRTQADFDNFRRRARLEKEDFAKYASFKLIEQLLPVLDNFNRAIAVSKDSSDTDSLLKGIEMVHRQFDAILTAEGLTPIEAVGQPFNPEYHQAIMQVESDEHEEGIVVEEIQKGYTLKDKVLRPSMVKVSS